MSRRGAPADPFASFDSFDADAPDRPSARDEVLAALAPWVDAHRRPAWRPLVAPGEPAGTRSKFGGRAWLLPGEAHTACEACGRPLQLLVQLDLGALPAELEGRYGSGLLQLLCCVDDGCSAEASWEPFSDVASLVRVVPLAALELDAALELATTPAPDSGTAAPPSAIVGWERFDDVPDPEDHELVGLSSSYDFALRTITLRCPEVGLEATLGLDDLGVEEIAQAAEGDKLAGWPSWTHGSEYPACPTCGQAMQLVFQLDSESNVPLTFGLAGIGHVTQCPTHLHTVAFGWSTS